MKNIENLCNAVIMQAVRDFRASVQRLKRQPGDINAQSTLSQLELFFRSDWFLILSGANGGLILEQLQKEAIG